MIKPLLEHHPSVSCKYPTSLSPASPHRGCTKTLQTGLYIPVCVNIWKDYLIFVSNDLTHLPVEEFWSRTSRVPIKSLQPAKYTPSFQMCICSAHFIKYVSDVTCVDSGLLHIPQCFSPGLAKAAATAKGACFKVWMFKYILQRFTRPWWRILNWEKDYTSQLVWDHLGKFHPTNKYCSVTYMFFTMTFSLNKSWKLNSC